jgi:hypothetical protein
MKGIVLDDIVTVRLAKANHPQIIEFQKKLAHHITEQLDLKLHEREEERRRLMEIFPYAIADILDIETLAQRYLTEVRPTMPLVCNHCVHCGPDRYHPGQFVCWEGWHVGLRPRQLPPTNTCTAFCDREVRNPRAAVAEFLADYGIHYSPQRWAGHRNDLKHEAGVWGFSAGRDWENCVRRFLEMRYGQSFFLPQRWLIAEKKDGGRYFREVDGLEKWSKDSVFVYEIKRNAQAYDKLVGEYIPLLQLGYPHMHFYPIEINSSNCYDYAHAMEDRGIEQLASLDDRDPSYAYQLYILDEADLRSQLLAQSITENGDT